MNSTSWQTVNNRARPAKQSLRAWPAVALLFALSACSGDDPASSNAAPPNIVIVMTDDQGWAQLGVHGNEVLRTPNLDRLAGESVEFTRFYVSPVCSPTRASLMTGRYNYRTGVVDVSLGRAMMHTDETTLAEILRDAGYRTGIFGKWHLGDSYPMRPMDQGFEQVLVHRGWGIGSPGDPAGTDYFNPILQHNGEEKKFEGYCTDVFFDAALRFIEQHRDQPFFTYLATNSPHSPYLVPESYSKPYRAQGLSDEDARIYGMIANIDDNVGRLLAKLEELGISENTALIFLTDNGPATRHFTAGLRGQKGAVYEGGIRVPFFVRWPAKLRPAKVDQIAAHIDVLPTLLEAAGIDRPAGLKLDGVSLMPLLVGDNDDWPERTLYVQWQRGNTPPLYGSFAAISEQFKLVQNRTLGKQIGREPRFELYDIKADPGEQNSIGELRKKTLARLKAGYERWFHDVSATRGYDPPRIVVGSEHENPVILTRQDWRAQGTDGWSDRHLGYWEVEVATAGSYDIRFRFSTQTRAGRAEFRLGQVKLRKPFTRSAESVTFREVELDAIGARLEARLIRAGRTVGVKYVDVTRLE